MVIHVFRHNVVYNSNINWSTFQKIQKGEIFLDMDMSVSTLQKLGSSQCFGFPVILGFLRGIPWILMNWTLPTQSMLHQGSSLQISRRKHV